jgi:hypothetical protein
MTTEEKTCPKCGSELVITLANQKHCNACSEEFQIDRHPVATAAARRKSQAFVGGWKGTAKIAGRKSAVFICPVS